MGPRHCKGTHPGCLEGSAWTCGALATIMHISGLCLKLREAAGEPGGQVGLEEALPQPDVTHTQQLHPQGLHGVSLSPLAREAEYRGVEWLPQGLAGRKWQCSLGKFRPFPLVGHHCHPSPKTAARANQVLRWYQQNPGECCFWEGSPPGAASRTLSSTRSHGTSALSPDFAVNMTLSAQLLGGTGRKEGGDGGWQ